jgi:adenosylcobinamide kinase/adenosylcobinamide-phosphate guanylyltransferase
VKEMSKIILVTGGARSGKSSYAEKLALAAEKEVLYVATSIPFDEEMKERVKKHKERRPKHWGTYEGYRLLKNIVDEEAKAYPTLLLDCVTILVTNLLYHEIGEEIESFSEEKLNIIETGILEEIKEFLDAIEKTSKTLILVTNEVGFGIVPENKYARVFRDVSGRINQYIASRADIVTLVVCGIPVKVK